MQNLLLSKLASAALELLVSGETVLFWFGVCLGLFADLTVMVIEITIARIISVNKIGSAETKLNDIGRTGWIVGSVTKGNGEVIGFGS